MIQHHATAILPWSLRARPGAPVAHEVAMLIPSIDVMGGKIVQLVQGEKKALEFSDFNFWIERFSEYPLVQLIDLDAAMRRRRWPGRAHGVDEHRPGRDLRAGPCELLHDDIHRVLTRRRHDVPSADGSGREVWRAGSALSQCQYSGSRL